MINTQRFFEIFHPEHYTLAFDIDRGAKTIQGTTTIVGEALDTEIYLHQKYLTILSVYAKETELEFEVLPDDEAVKILLKDEGEVTLTIKYETKLTDTMMGIYPSYYMLDGEKKQIIGTQFESTAARQAFLCVDEPEAKATFDLQIKFDEQPGETILANMPENKEVDGVHYFDRTLKMSTYLVAFVFGDLQSQIVTTKSGIKVGVFATKAHAANELDFATDIAKRSIEFFEDFYQTPYPLPQAYNVALPDFSAGAMENWGLLTYREAYLVLDEDKTALDTKQLVATVIAHELAHQWFGDLVTMKWWDDLWLNESFANMMEYVAIDAIEPDWKIWEMFQTSESQAALFRDATDGVQSVHVPVNNPGEIDSLFDGAIVYAKGARMLVMARAMIGDDALRKGLKAYFAEHQYGNATGDDLWQAFSDASGIDVGTVMKTWLEQPGYPVVTASLKDDKIVLSQEQFFIGEAKPQNRQWQIPLESNFAELPEIMKDQEVSVAGYKELRAKYGVPFRLNVGNNSHFIVQYDDELMADILANTAALNSIDQLQLLQAQQLLASGSKISYADIVPLLAKFQDSTSNIVNATIFRLLGDLQEFVEPKTDEEKQFKLFVNQLSKDQVARLGWAKKANESMDDKLSRRFVLANALYAENADASAAAHELYQANEANPEALDASVRYLVLKNEVKNYGSKELLEKLIKAYQTTSNSSYKTDLRVAVTSTKDPELVKLVISKFEDADTVKPQDLRGWYAGVLGNDAGEQAAWDWLRNDWSWLEKTVGGDMEFTTFITVTANVFKTANRLAEFKEFFEPKLNVPGFEREIKMDTNVIASRVALIAAGKDEVAAAVAKALN